MLQTLTFPLSKPNQTIFSPFPLLPFSILIAYVGCSTFNCQLPLPGQEMPAAEKGNREQPSPNGAVAAARGSAFQLVAQVPATTPCPPSVASLRRFNHQHRPNLIRQQIDFICNTRPSSPIIPFAKFLMSSDLLSCSTFRFAKPNHTKCDDFHFMQVFLGHLNLFYLILFLKL